MGQLGRCPIWPQSLSFHPLLKESEVGHAGRVRWVTLEDVSCIFSGYSNSPRSSQGHGSPISQVYSVRITSHTYTQGTAMSQIYPSPKATGPVETNPTQSMPQSPVPD